VNDDDEPVEESTALTPDEETDTKWPFNIPTFAIIIAGIVLVLAATGLVILIVALIVKRRKQ